VRKHVEKLPDTAHHLVSLPGESYEDEQGARGPGGVLVVCEDGLIFKRIDQPEVTCKVPVRMDWPSDKGLMIATSQAFFNQGTCIVFMLSEVGDLYRVFIEYAGEALTNIRVSYFDSFDASVGMKILLS
jgi:splicing factor 3B subunit 3